MNRTSKKPNLLSNPDEYFAMRRRGDATHEAGHAVCGLVMGGLLEHVLIRKDGTGECRWLMNPWIPPATGTRSIRFKNPRFAEVILAVAGWVAEIQYADPLDVSSNKPHPLLVSTEVVKMNLRDVWYEDDELDLIGDTTIAARHATMMGCKSIKQIHALLLRAEELARQIIRRKESEVLALADALLASRSGRLSERQVLTCVNFKNWSSS